MHEIQLTFGGGGQAWLGLTATVFKKVKAKTYIAEIRVLGIEGIEAPTLIALQKKLTEAAREVMTLEVSRGLPHFETEKI